MSDHCDVLIGWARLFKKIRAFFDAEGYLEVSTPLLAAATNTDPHIQSVEAKVNGCIQYLQTSPEFAMKRLLANGAGSIYQITHAFRDEEQGRYHQAEFSLLEWYSVGMDYHQLMKQLQALISQLFDQPLKFHSYRYQALFQQRLQFDPLTIGLTELRVITAEQVIGTETNHLSRDDCLDLLISCVISPQFDGFTFVHDYPASQAALARLCDDDQRVAERFELFYGALELANGFGELTDAREQRRRFEIDNQQRVNQGLPAYAIDEALLGALEKGLPECSGVALGLDRVMMLLSKVDHIQQVRPL